MKKIMGRLHDWRQERRIQTLTKLALWYAKQGLVGVARVIDEERLKVIRGRSPEQIARMERRMGLR